MRQDHQQRIGTAQKQVLSQSARQLVEMIVLPPADFAELVRQRVRDNPFLSISSPPLQGAAGLAEPVEAGPGLFAHVLAELPLLVRTPAELAIAMRLAEGLDEQGFLVEDLSAIAGDLALPRASVDAVLARIQRIEPAGLFARSVSECFALQLREEGMLDDVAIRVLCDLDGLAAEGPDRFAAGRGLDPARVRGLIDRISRLRRSPAADFGGPVATALPELIFERRGEEWTVSAAALPVPRARLRPGALATDLAKTASPEARAELRRQWRDAQVLCRAMGLRDETLLALGRLLIEGQRTGLDSAFTVLAPLTQREVAARLSVHESTIGRIVKHRFASVRGRTVPLACFFERPRPTKDGRAQTRSFVLAALRQLFETGQAAALSDQALVDELAASGIAVTRRRLAKYRDRLGFPSSHGRGAKAVAKGHIANPDRDGQEAGNSPRPRPDPQCPPR